MKRANEKDGNQEQIYSYRLNDDEIIDMFGIEKLRDVKYTDSKFNSLMMAKIFRNKPGHAIDLDLVDYVAFEVEKDLPITQKDKENIVQQYLKQKQGKEPTEGCMYLGRFEEGIPLGEKNEAVMRYVTEVIGQNIEEENRKKREQRQNMRKANEEREYFIARIDARKNIEEINSKRTSRMQNPWIQQIATIIKEGRQLENYDGVNINTGDILKLRNVDKIGKDGSGTYLYQGNLTFTLDRNDVEILGTQLRNLVCFELDERLSDIVARNNPQEISNLLAFLSDRQNTEKPNELNYIGKLDKFGQIERKEESDSLAIANKIKELKIQHKNKIMENEKFDTARGNTQ